MKKYSHIVILTLSLVFCSCLYEYEMPDYSNAVTCYNKTQLESGIENKIREAYSKYDVEAVNIEIQEEHAIEKDVSGSIIYDGDARGRANIRSKSLELSYAVKHRIRHGGGHYQSVVANYQRSFDIDVSPFEVKASVTNEQLQIQFPFYIYWVTKQSFNNTIFDKVDELNYEFADAKIYVTELDKEKKDLLRYEHEDPYGKPWQPPVLSQIGAEYIYVEIEIYGWPKDEYRVYYDKRGKVGAFVFNEFKLSEINNSTLELSSDMEYEFVEEQGLMTFYNVKNSLPMISKANELGFEFSSWKMFISEKDSVGNILYRFEHESTSGIIEAQKGATTIDVEVEIYGRVKAVNVDYHQEIKLGKFVIKDIRLSDIKNSTLELSSDMEYEFVEEQGLMTFYNVKNSLPMISKANELGFEFSSWKMFISEKDSVGNILYRFEHESIKGMIGSQKGATTIDVEVEIYGWPKEDGRVNYNKKQKIGTFVIKDIFLSDINNSTLELTDDMHYEFVR